MSPLLAEVALLGSALGSAALLHRKAQADARPATLRVMSLGALSVALATLGRLTLSQGGQELQTLRLMLDNLALYAGLPLFALAIFARGFGLDWSRAAWGRWLLGCFALFELCRRFDNGALYGQGLALAISLGLLAGSLRGETGNSRLTALAGALVAAAGLLLLGPWTLVPEWRQDVLYPLALAVFLPLSSLGTRLRRA